MEKIGPKRERVKPGVRKARELTRFLEIATDLVCEDIEELGAARHAFSSYGTGALRLVGEEQER